MNLIIQIIVAYMLGRISVWIAYAIVRIAMKIKARRYIAHDIDMKTWERIEGWRK